MAKTYAAICSECGEGFDAKFKPKGETPVYCIDCYKELNGYY